MTLRLEFCLECGNTCLVAPVEPWRGEEPTGFYLSYMDGLQETHILGCLCKACAFRLVDEGYLSMVGGGGMLPDLYAEKYLPKFPQFEFDQESEEE